ncbi:hypothetical protein PYCC9005_001759 [Savitreella phatthalungensis]
MAMNDPQTWSFRKKWGQTLLLTLMTLNVQIAGSIFAPAMRPIEAEFGVAQEVVVLGITLTLLGFAFAPMVLAPLAESVGRLPIYWGGYLLFLLFSIAVADAPNVVVLLVFRFLIGVAGAPCNTMIAGSITDMFPTDSLGPPMSVFILVGLLLPVPLGPLIGGFILQRFSWRYVFWWPLVPAAAMFILLFLPFMCETRMHKHSPKLTTVTLPWKMLAGDIVVASFSLWLAFSWGVTYGLLESVDEVFRTLYGFDVDGVGCVYIGLIIAVFVGWPAAVFGEAIWRRPRPQPCKDDRAESPSRSSCSQSDCPPPERRLILACIGAPMVPAGLFTYGWTSYRSVSFYAPIFGVGLTFFGIFTIYYSVFLYLSTGYSSNAASALSAAGFWRNIFAAAFPLFTRQMYQRLTYHWASSLLGFVALALGIIPVALLSWGHYLRARSKFIEA